MIVAILLTAKQYFELKSGSNRTKLIVNLLLEGHYKATYTTRVPGVDNTLFELMSLHHVIIFYVDTHDFFNFPQYHNQYAECKKLVLKTFELRVWSDFESAFPSYHQECGFLKQK